MTCTRIGNAIICASPSGRLHLGNKYIFMTFHEYCGPMFYTDRNYSKQYKDNILEEDDPVWPVFSKWLHKYELNKSKQRKINNGNSLRTKA